MTQPAPTASAASAPTAPAASPAAALPGGVQLSPGLIARLQAEGRGEPPSAAPPAVASPGIVDGAVPADAPPAAEAPPGDAVTPPTPPTPPEDPRLARAREGAAKARARVQRERQLQGQAAQLRHAQESQAGELARLRSLEQTLRADPLAALKALGLTTEQMARRAIEEGKPESAIAALQEQLSQERAARQAFEQRIAQGSQAQQRAQAEEVFVRDASNATRFPALAGVSRHILLAAGKQFAQDTVARGFGPPTNAQLLELLNEAFLSSAPPAKAPPTPEKPKVPTQSLSNETVTRNWTWTPPPDWDSLSGAERDKALAQMIRQRRKT